MTIQNLVLFTTFLGHILILIILFFLAKRTNYRNYFLIAEISIIGWLLSNFFVFNYEFNIIGMLVKLSFAFPVILIWSLLRFSYEFPNNLRDYLNLSKRRMDLALFSFDFLSIILITLVFLGKIVEGIERNDKVTESIAGELYILYFIFILVGLFITLSILSYKFFHTKGKQKIQLQYIFISIFLSALIALITNLILPFVFNYSGLGQFGTISTIILVLGTLIAIIRFQFLDIKVFLGKIAFILFISTIYYISFFFIAKLYLVIFGELFISQVYFFGFAIAIIYVLFVNTVTNYLRERIDSSLINPGFNPTEVITKINSTLSLLLDYREIVDETNRLLSRTIRADYNSLAILHNTHNLEIITKENRTKELEDSEGLSYAYTIWLNTEDDKPINLYELDLGMPKHFENMHNWLHNVRKVMEKNNLKLLIPINYKENFLGMIILGAKESDIPYDSIEIGFLEDLAKIVASSLSRAFLHKEVQELNLNLQKRIDEATGELRSKVDALEEARRKERDMLDILGHELRTPLTIVRNAILMLESLKSNRNMEQEKLEKYIDMAKSNLNREVKLLETMLTTTKIDNDKLYYKLEEYKLSEISKNLEDAFAQKAKDKNLDFNVDKSNLSIFVDRTRFQEVMDNLVDNAIKYTEHGEINIKYRELEDKILIDITDTGIGISKGDLPKLGRKFYRTNTYLDSSKNTGIDIVRPGGTGLGLYVVFKLVENMRGKIKIDSELGKGTTFTIEVPKYTGQKVEEIGDAPEKLHERFERMKKEKKN